MDEKEKEKKKPRVSILTGNYQCDIFGFLFRTVIIVPFLSPLSHPFSESVVKLYRESRRTAARKYARRFMNMQRGAYAAMQRAMQHAYPCAP